MDKYICPKCQNPIYDDEAILCLYCGGSLNREGGLLSKIKAHNYKTIVIFITLAVIISFILLLIL